MPRDMMNKTDGSFLHAADIRTRRKLLPMSVHMGENWGLVKSKWKHSITGEKRKLTFQPTDSIVCLWRFKESPCTPAKKRSELSVASLTAEPAPTCWCVGSGPPAVPHLGPFGTLTAHPRFLLTRAPENVPSPDPVAFKSLAARYWVCTCVRELSNYCRRRFIIANREPGSIVGMWVELCTFVLNPVV